MIDLKWNLNELAESFLHPVFVSGGVVAQDQVETRFEVTLIIITENDRTCFRGWLGWVVVGGTCSDMIHSKDEQASLYWPGKWKLNLTFVKESSREWGNRISVSSDWPILTKRTPMLCIILIRIVLCVFGTWDHIIVMILSWWEGWPNHRWSSSSSTSSP